MARTKQMARKRTGGLPKATKEDIVKSKGGGDGDDAQPSMSGGGQGKPVPKIKAGRVDRRKQDMPVRRISMEE